MKTKSSMTVMWLPQSKVYFVKEVTNSTEFTPDDLINKTMVDTLIATGSWTIKIVQRKGPRSTSR